MAWSSFDVRDGSRNFGDGESFGVESESERALEGDFDGVRTAKKGLEPSSEFPPSSPVEA